ncbi:MAG TPA: hypothetical protein EYQ12_07620 [Oceanospirillaceae bacterium]|nr:hypothetical protein [Oceanospirillaceae bacterium]
MKLSIVIVACLVLSACAGSAPQPSLLGGEDTEVPSFTASYDAFSCDQLSSEARRITEQMHDIASVRDADAEMERLELIGGVLYWPILLFVDGSSDSAGAQAEYEQLKARLLNLSGWVSQKQCNV